MLGCASKLLLPSKTSIMALVSNKTSHMFPTSTPLFQHFSIWWKFSKVPAGSGNRGLLSSNGWGLLAAASMPSRWVTNRTCGWTQDFPMSDFWMQDFWQTKRFHIIGRKGGMEKIKNIPIIQYKGCRWWHDYRQISESHTSYPGTPEKTSFSKTTNLSRPPSDRNTATKWAPKNVKLLWIYTRSLLTSSSQVLKGPFLKALGFSIHIHFQSEVIWHSKKLSEHHAGK